MIDFITKNIYSVALLISTIGVLFYLHKIGRKMFVKRILKQLIIKAENFYGSGQGLIKKNYVINELYDKAKILSVFLSIDEINALIELILDEIKEKLE